MDPSWDMFQRFVGFAQQPGAMGREMNMTAAGLLLRERFATAGREKWGQARHEENIPEEWDNGALCPWKKE